jgi:hypothetical protein
MAEDPRISEIRSVLDEYVRPDDLDALHGVRRRIHAIVDREPPAPEPWQVEAHIQEQRATSLGYCEHVVETYPDGEEDTCSNLRRRGEVTCDEHAPRAFFPGDTVPAGTYLLNRGGFVILPKDEPWEVISGTYVEQRVPPPEEWQAAVDRARDARANAEWQHTDGTNP